MTDLERNLTPDEARLYSPLTLAFYGDSVYEKLVRKELVLEANRPAGELHTLAVKLVNAVYQAQAVHSLPEGTLTEEEEYIYKRGRNAHGINAPKSAKNSDYRSATGLEALFRYLSLTGRQDRCLQLYRIIRENTEVPQ